MKQKLAIFTTAITLAVFAIAMPASALSEDQRGAISQNCSSMKQSLRALQRTDARSRSYLGSAYEAVLSNFITPLDLRLINTGQPNASLTELHSSILSTRQKFISEYTTYSQSLEELLYADCQNHPDDFYNKLQDTRKKRAELSATTTNLRNLLSEHLTSVRKVKNNLGEKNAE